MLVLSIRNENGFDFSGASINLMLESNLKKSNNAGRI